MKKVFFIGILIFLLVGCKQNNPINKCYIFNGKGDSIEVQIKYDTVDAIRPSWIENDRNSWYEKDFVKSIISLKNVNPKILNKIPGLLKIFAATCKASCKYQLTFAPIKNDSIHIYFIRAMVERPSEQDIVTKIDSMQRATSSILDSIMLAEIPTADENYKHRIFIIEDSLNTKASKDSAAMLRTFKNELPKLLAKFEKDSAAFNKDSCSEVLFEWIYSCTNAMGTPVELTIRVEYSPYSLMEIPYSKEIKSENEADSK
jgi:hypothetical protein